MAQHASIQQPADGGLGNAHNVKQYLRETKCVERKPENQGVRTLETGLKKNGSEDECECGGEGCYPSAKQGLNELVESRATAKALPTGSRT